MCVSALTETVSFSCQSSGWNICYHGNSAQLLVTVSHTQSAGARADEISAHQRETHCPACCFFKAFVNFFATNLCLQVVDKVTSSNAIAAIFCITVLWPKQHTMNDYIGICETFPQKQFNGGSVLVFFPPFLLFILLLLLLETTCDENITNSV